MVTVPDIRWQRVDIKSVALLPNVLAKQTARDRGAREAWLVDAQGRVTEGASSNAWIVSRDGKLITRPLGRDILPGITRSVVLDVIRVQGLVLEERAFTVEEAYAGTRRRVTVHEHGRPRVVDVQIPAGVGEGQALRIGGAAGRQALVFRVRVRHHALYALQGKDVLVELPLAPWEAALGTKVAVPTLGGTVELTIPTGAQSGQKLRLRGRGLPGNPAGDQIVSIKLVTPAAETAAQKEAYERMKRELKFDPRANWPHG